MGILACLFPVGRECPTYDPGRNTALGAILPDHHPELQGWTINSSICLPVLMDILFAAPRQFAAGWIASRQENTATADSGGAKNGIADGDCRL